MLQTCPTSVTATFSNFALTGIAPPTATATASGTPPPPSPSATPTATPSQSGTATASWSTGALPSLSSSASSAPAQSGSWNGAGCAGALTVTVDGAAQSWSVVQQPWMRTAVTSNGGGVSVNGGDRAYLVGACASSFSAGMYAPKRVYLLGKTVSYTVNAASAGCGCQASLSFMQMPSADAQGRQMAGGLGDGYCDAASNGGTWCPELDAAVLNTASLVSSVRACTVPAVPGYYQWNECQQRICAGSAASSVGATAFGPGAGYTIDTTQAYTVSTSFPVDGSGKLTSVSTTISQAGRRVSWTLADGSTCSNGDIGMMSVNLASGMVPVVQLSGADTVYSPRLAVGACAGTATGSCSGAAIVTFSTIAITTIGGGGVSPSATASRAAAAPSPAGAVSPSASASHSAAPPTASSSATKSASGSLTPAATPSGTPSQTPSRSRSSAQTGTWAAAKCAGALTVTMDGAAQTWGVTAPTWATTSANGGAVTLKLNDKGYLTSTCGTAFSAGLYSKRIPILGRTVSYTANLASVPCGCNAAVPLLALPAINSLGQAAAGANGDGACSANTAPYCAHYDMQAGNTAAWMSAAHSCAAPSSAGATSSCDANGCGLFALKKIGTTAYGRGAGYTIDTTLPFSVSASFRTDATGALSSIVTVLAQSGRSITLTHDNSSCAAGYVRGLTSSLSFGLNPMMTVWGGGAAGGATSWLDSPPCSATAPCTAATAVYSNWAVNSIRAATLTTSTTLTVSGGALSWDALLRDPSALLSAALAMRCDVAAALGVPVSKVVLNSVSPAAGSGSTAAPIPASAISPSLNTLAISCPYNAPGTAGAMAQFFVAARRVQAAGAAGATLVSGLTFDAAAETHFTDNDLSFAAAAAAALTAGADGANATQWVLAAGLDLPMSSVAVSATAETAAAAVLPAPVVPDAAPAANSGLSAGAIAGIAVGATIAIAAVAGFAAVAVRRRRRNGGGFLLHGSSSNATRVWSRSDASTVAAGSPGAGATTASPGASGSVIQLTAMAPSSAGSGSTRAQAVATARGSFAPSKTAAGSDDGESAVTLNPVGRGAAASARSGRNVGL